MYIPQHLAISMQDKLSVFRKHIPKQQEIGRAVERFKKTRVTQPYGQFRYERFNRRI